MFHHFKTSFLTSTHGNLEKNWENTVNNNNSFSLFFPLSSWVVSQIWTQDVASAYCFTQPPGWIEHMILVMKFNSFAVINQTVLFAHKHTGRMRYCPRSNSVKFREHLSKVLTFFWRRTTKPLERRGRLNLQGPKWRPETSKFYTSERQHIAITVSKYTSFLLWHILQQSLHLLCLWPPLSLSLPRVGTFTHKKGILRPTVS